MLVSGGVWDLHIKVNVDFVAILPKPVEVVVDVRAKPIENMILAQVVDYHGELVDLPACYSLAIFLGDIGHTLAVIVLRPVKNLQRGNLDEGRGLKDDWLVEPPADVRFDQIGEQPSVVARVVPDLEVAENVAVEIHKLERHV